WHLILAHDQRERTLVTAPCEPQDVGIRLRKGQRLSGWLRKPHELYTTHGSCLQACSSQFPICREVSDGCRGCDIRRSCHHSIRNPLDLLGDVTHSVASS